MSQLPTYNYKNAECPAGHLMERQTITVPPGIADRFAREIARFLTSVHHGTVVFIDVPQTVSIMVMHRTVEEIREIDAQNEAARSKQPASSKKPIET